jgi:hypothetical protein
MKLDLTKQFDLLIFEAEKELTEEGNVCEIEYKTNKITKEVLGKAYEYNAKTLDKILEGGANIYALWVKKAGTNKWLLMYIGQRKLQFIRSRLVQHLFQKNEQTGSQLEKIKKEVKEKNKIGVTVIKVLPDELRQSVEERLIGISKTKNNCFWNIHG